MLRYLLLCLALAGCSSDYSYDEPSERYFSPIVEHEISFEESKTDSFRTPNHKPADFYFLFDRSCSMFDDQENIAVPEIRVNSDQMVFEYLLSSSKKLLSSQPMFLFLNYKPMFL